MEIFLSAVLGELAVKSMSFIIGRYSRPSALAMEDSLQRILLRAQVIVDEAAGRHITNRGMIQQLSKLIDAMHRGHYVLDTFRYQAHEEDDEAEDQAVSLSSSSTLSKFNHARRCLSLSMTSSHRRSVEAELQEVLGCLNTMILDASELVVFLQSYPRLCRQPYSMHLLLANCMFGRQTEMQLVINFLLCTSQPHGDHALDVLPIVGPGRVGKSTLVAHVCKDERVRDHFSQIMFFGGENLTSEKLANLSDRDAVARPNATMKENVRVLVVAEVDGDIGEDAWKILCFLASKQCAARSGKIIIASRSNEIVKYGTVQALALKPLPHEAYWNFFKAITFGTRDPDMHPRLTYLAMEIAKTLNESFIAAYVTACQLRKNFNAHYWSNIMAFSRGHVQKNICKFGEHPCDRLNENKPICLGRLGSSTKDFLVYNQHQTCSSHVDIPKIRMHDVIIGKVKPHGKFEVLTWTSQIPPYRNYICTFEIREKLSRTVSKRKRPLK